MVKTYASPETIRQELERVRELLLSRKEKVELLRTRAETAGAIRYDKDKVTSTPKYDLSDAIIHIIEAEDAVKEAQAELDSLTRLFTIYCINAGFDNHRCAIWIGRYVYGWSIGQIASGMGLARSTIQYHLGKNAEEAFLSASDGV